MPFPSLSMQLSPRAEAHHLLLQHTPHEGSDLTCTSLSLPSVHIMLCPIPYSKISGAFIFSTNVEWTITRQIFQQFPIQQNNSWHPLTAQDRTSSMPANHAAAHPPDQQNGAVHPLQHTVQSVILLEILYTCHIVTESQGCIIKPPFTPSSIKTLYSQSE